MDWQNIHSVIVFVQHCISTVGVVIIATGVFFCLCQYLYYIFSGRLQSSGGASINAIRLNLSRVLILGLEFIVAADLIGSTTTPDYYAVGLLAIIVIVRTVLTFSINKEILSLSKES